jgi:class 3 adenylate cyclase
MKRKIAAIVAADVAGYSRLVAEDEEETLRRLASYRSVIDDFIAKAPGRIFNTAGDAIMAEFASAVDAVRCAIDIQESLRTRNLAYPPSRQMKLRIGITVGDVVEREGDLLGDGVNIAARLQTLAEPGGICVSRSVYEQVSNKLSVRFADLGNQQVKNIPTPVHAYLVAMNAPNMAAPTTRGNSRTGAIMWPRLAAVAILAVAGGALCFYLFVMSRSGFPVAKPPSSLTTADLSKQQSAATGQPSSTSERRESSAPQPATFHFDESLIRTHAAKQDIPLPATLNFIGPSPAVPKSAADYFGVWGGDERWGGGGRQMILVVTSIDISGAAFGVYAEGPPNARTFNQSPAKYVSFQGAITDSGLRFEAFNGSWTYQFKLVSANVLSGRADGPNDTHPTIIISRINPNAERTPGSDARPPSPPSATAPPLTQVPVQGASPVAQPIPSAQKLTDPGSVNCAARTAGARVFATEPPRGAGALGVGEKAYVNDGQCPAGYIKEIIGGGRGVGRGVQCVPCQ